MENLRIYRWFHLFFSLSTVENAPNYVQLKPSLRSHFVSIIKHALQQHSVEDIVWWEEIPRMIKAWFKFFSSHSG